MHGKLPSSRGIFAGLAAAAIALTAAACGGDESGATAGDEETFTFKVADSFPEGHISSEQVAKPFMENVEEASDGRITFEYYPAEQLGAAADLLDLTKGGVTDIGYIAPLYYSAELPLGSIGGLPGVYPDAPTGAVAYHELVTGSLYEAEIEEHGVQPLFSIATGEYQIATSEKKVMSTADVRGLRLRTSGGYQEMTVSELGGTGVSLAAPEMYQAIQQGTVDGTLISAESIPPYGLDELVTQLTSNLALGGFTAFYAINGEKWESLPDDLKDVMIEEGERITEAGGQAFAEAKQELLSDFESQGISVNELPEDAVAEFDAVSTKVQDAWAKDLEARGLPARDILDEFLELTGQAS